MTKGLHEHWPVTISQEEEVEPTMLQRQPVTKNLN